MIAGLLLITAAVLLTGYNCMESYWADQTAQNAAQTLKQKVGEETPAADDADVDLSERQMPTMEIDGYRYIGYLEIPTLDLTLPVMETWDYKRLRQAVCCYSGTIYQNNMVIAGHNYRRFFSHLRWLSLESEVDFVDVEGNRYSYQVSNVEILKPGQGAALIGNNDDWDLTLFTCTIGGRTRYTVRCVRI